MKKYFTKIMIIISPLFGYSQTGPGGVEDITGTSNLVLWLDANTISQIDGTNVSTWSDQSGYSNSAVAVAGNEPVYQTNILNGFPIVRFTTGNTDYLRVSDDVSLKPNTISIFIVGLHTGSSPSWSPFLIKTSTYSWSNGYGITMESNTSNHRTFVSHWSTNAVVSGHPNNTFEIMGTVYDKVNIELFDNETSQGSDNYVSNIVHTTNYLYIGIAPNGAGTGVQQPLDGDISEAIIIDRNVNSAERIIIHNYLAAKYGLTLGTNDVFNEDDAGNGNYDYDVAGIGRVDASNLHNDAQGTGVVRILNPTGLDDDEFLLWGHNNGVQQATETTDIPASVQARFDRVWRVSEVNASTTAVDVGSIDVRFDLTGLGSITATDLRLLVDTDNDGVFIDETPISGATLTGGSVYQFAGVSAIANNLRFTLATINTNQTPLPIELLNFNAKVINKESVKIYWQTASELNNDYFTVERSKNGFDWNEIKTIDGAGNSFLLLDYTTNDFKPYKGISYYRLKQTDFDGVYSYSNIVSVKVQNVANNQINIYPNPTSNKIIIEGNSVELETIDVYNILGENVSNQTIFLKINNGKIIIDLSRLSTGTYYVKTKTTANKVYKQ